MGERLGLEPYLPTLWAQYIVSNIKLPIADSGSVYCEVC
jgi:hypothetical protein